MSEPPPPIVASVLMGYGHLRAAIPLADALGVPVARIDEPPLATPKDIRLWRRVLHLYEWVSRLSQTRAAGFAFRPVLDGITAFPPLHPPRDLSAPVRAVHTLDRMAAKGLGESLLEKLRETGAPLLTTFYAPAILADRAGLERIGCVVTDADVHRVWAPLDPERTRIRYYVPSERAGRRIAAYGVPEENIEFTGFPLPAPPEDRPLEDLFAARLGRLDPAVADDPPLVTFVVGGAGAQAGIVARALPSLAPAIGAGRLRLALVAGIRPEVGAAFRRAVRSAGLEPRLGDGIDVLAEPDLDAYYRAFDRLMWETDVLWTKPSELVFYGGLGIPEILAPPVGVQEKSNRRWILDRGAALDQRDPRHAGHWIREWLDEGVLAAAAEAAFRNLPRDGTSRITNTGSRFRSA